MEDFNFVQDGRGGLNASLANYNRPIPSLKKKVVHAHKYSADFSESGESSNQTSQS